MYSRCWRQKFLSSNPSHAGFSCERWYHYIDACCVLLSISLAARVLSWSQTLGCIGSRCWTCTVQSCCPAKSTWWTCIINEHFIWIYFLPFYYVVARLNAINEWSWFCLQCGNLWMNQCKIFYTFLYSYTIIVIVNVHSKCVDSKAWHQNNTCHSNLQWFVIIWSVVPANKMSADLHPFLHAWQLIIPCSCVRFLLLKITNWFKKTLKPCLLMSCSWKPDNIEKVPLRVNWQDGQTSSSLGPWYYSLHWPIGSEGLYTQILGKRILNWF